jgi:uncharacterized membrane protein
VIYSVTIDISAPIAAVWPVMADVERWHEWTASISSIRILDQRPLGIGSRARIRQPKLPPAEWTVTELEPERGFTWISRGPGLLVTGRHYIESRGNGSRVTLSIQYEGLLGRLVGWVTRELNLLYIGLEAAGLKRRCEGR